jgi:hypothetical protein
MVGAVAGASGVTAPAAGDVLFSALALVPAFVGVYLGVFVRRASARFEKAETH